MASSAPRIALPVIPDTIQSKGGAEVVHDPHTVQLSDGRRVHMRETTLRDDEEVLKRLQSAGYVMADLHPISLARFSAIFAIDAVNGERIVPPKGRAQIEGFLNDFKSADAMRVIRLYSIINGLVEDEDATFPDKRGDDTP